MSFISFLNKCKPFLHGRSTLIMPTAELNTRRKLARRRYRLEPRRRISAYFENPNTIDALRNGPDYTFLDHRPTPYGIHQYKRICQSIEHTAQIIKCNNEIDLALKLEKMRTEEKQEEIQAVLDRKLKPKGGTVETSPKKS